MFESNAFSAIVHPKQNVPRGTQKDWNGFLGMKTKFLFVVYYWLLGIYKKITTIHNNINMIITINFINEKRQ